MSVSNIPSKNTQLACADHSRHPAKQLHLKQVLICSIIHKCLHNNQEITYLHLHSPTRYVTSNRTCSFSTKYSFALQPYRVCHTQHCLINFQSHLQVFTNVLHGFITIWLFLHGMSQVQILFILNECLHSFLTFYGGPPLRHHLAFTLIREVQLRLGMIPDQQFAGF